MNAGLLSSNLEEQILQSLSEFRALATDMEEKNQNTEEIHKVIESLEESYAKLTAESTPHSKNCHIISKGLKKIYDFYSSKQQFPGVAPSFADIEHGNSIWNNAKFLKFCKDFGLDEIKREDLLNIFKANASFRREMNEDQFKAALKDIAQKLFKNEPEEAKMEKMYDYLKVYDLDYIQKIAKGFGLPFSKEKIDFRVQGLPETKSSEKKLPKHSSLPNIHTPKIKDLEKIEKVKATKKFVKIPLQSKTPHRYSDKKLLLSQNPLRYTWQKLSQITDDVLQVDKDLENIIERTVDNRLSLDKNLLQRDLKKGNMEQPKYQIKTHFKEPKH
ncbi:unnamed protein product [Blepharisma stoltei]|uniref:Uncharacterized protein n=1 Tax=Blepharisma stoltei TaxID=1481888 RepID=A0AAU9JVB8_9CILI|nr:unnamed protein product [Blepharisma stoltei]